MPRMVVYGHEAVLEADRGTIQAVQNELLYPEVRSPTGFASSMDDRGHVKPGIVPRVEWLFGEWEDPLEVVYENSDSTATSNWEVEEIPLWEHLFAHQQDSVKRIVSERCGIHMGPARSGKTHVAAAVFQYLSDLRPAVFLVDGKDLFRQSIRKLEELLGERIGRVGAGADDPRDITVAMVQTVRQRKWWPWLSSLELAIIDECHGFASDKSETIRAQMTCIRRVYGISATPWRHDEKDILLESNVGPIISTLKWSRLIRDINPNTGRPFLVPPIIVFQRMPKVEAGSGDEWSEVYQYGIVDNEIRNQAVFDFNEYLSSRGKSCVTSVARLDHGQTLADALDCPFTQGTDSTATRNRVLEDLCDGTLLRCTSTLYGQGVDIPSLTGMVNAMGGKSSIDFFQGLRNLTAPIHDTDPPKPCAPTLDMFDTGQYIGPWSRARFDFAKKEPEFVVVARKDYLHGSLGKSAEAVWDWLDPYLDGTKAPHELVT